MKVSERIAVVTGATSGIGEAMAGLLAEQGGWHIIGVGRNTAKLQRLKTQLKNQFSEVRADLTTEKGAHKLALTVAQFIKRPDLISAVFQCAGGVPNDRLFRRLLDTPLAVLEEMISVNLISKFLVTKALLPYLGSGSCIVNVASIAAHEIFPNEVAYHTAMWGVRGLTLAMDAELQEQGIRVASISPGSVRTPLMERLVAKGQFPEDELERALEPKQVAEIMLQLAENVWKGAYVADILVKP